MTWFKVLKRGVKVNPEYIKQVLHKIVNRDGYVILGKHTIEDFYDEYKNILREKQQQAVTSTERREFSTKIATISQTFRYSSARLVAITNNIASKIFRIKISSRTPIEGDLKGLRTEIIKNGSIYFKNMDARNEYVEQARKIVDKKRYAHRRRAEFR